MRRAVFGEEDDAAVVPLAVRSQVGLDPFDDRTAFRIRLVTGALGPIAQSGKQAQFFFSRRSAAFRGFLDRFVLCGLRLSVVRIILFRFEDRLAQDAVGHRIGFLLGFPLVSVLKCLSSVEANAAGDEKSRFFRRPFTNLVPDAPASRQVFSRLLQYESRTLCIARSSAVKGTESACKLRLG